MQHQSPPGRRSIAATRRSSSRTRGSVTAASALVLGLLGGGLAPLSATAAPAPAPGARTFAPGQTVAGEVPDGACFVDAHVAGGAGGRSAPGANGIGSNGAGAVITARFAVVPGMQFTGAVGGGGDVHHGKTGGAGGVNGGGAGGSAKVDHAGAGGGGFSSLSLGGDLAVVAGGGGGSGGGHSTTNAGFGGAAGLPTSLARTANGVAGTDGRDRVGLTAGGGQGGGTTTTEPGGAGGVHSTTPTLNGGAGAAGAGGAGAEDPNYDAAGGGGGGYFGGGAGAATLIQNDDDGLKDVAGGGGGGGSSFVASTATDVSAKLHGQETGTGPGDSGSVTLTWVPCAYDLDVTKKVSVTPSGAPSGVAPVGSTLTWTVTVTNTGPSAMTRGDTVTLADSLPGTGAKTLLGYSTSAAASTSSSFQSGPVTCGTAIGGTMPAVLTCARPYALPGGAADGVRGLDVGESLTVVYTQAVSDPAGTVLANTASVTDRTVGDTNDSATATVTVVGPPTATDDDDLGNVIGEPVTVPVLTNDTAGLPVAGVVLHDTTAGTWVTELVVDGEGTWTVANGSVAFVPEPGFLVDPAPVTYRVTDENGLTDTATVTVTYVPQTATDGSWDHLVGDAATVDVLANDTGVFDASTVRLLDGTRPVTSLAVPGEGTWTVDAGTGAVTFTPEAGFLVDPTSVTYQVIDVTGDVSAPTVVHVGYLPTAVDDADLRNTIGSVVTIDVVTNDVGDMDRATVMLVDNRIGVLVRTLVVPGEGTWTADPTTGKVTFTPEAGYTGNPTPVDYEVRDTTGDGAAATITVTYLPEADPDVKAGNVLGSTVTVDVLGNDTGRFDRTSVRLVGPTGARVTRLAVAGEGTWTVDGATGAVTFAPVAGFVGNPTPVQYEVRNTAGDPVTSLVTVTYVPEAADDRSEGNVPGSTVTVPTVGNDNGTLDRTSVRLVGPTGALVTTLVVAGEGTWTVDPTTGAITFTPAAGFTGNPTPVTYQVTDQAGSTTTAEVAITYAPAPAAAPMTPTPPPTTVANVVRDALAVTGWSPVAGAAGGLTLLLAGVAALVVSRRRATR
ncbi:Ig-like domain-containing protein [Cellulomonas fengjieae]|uniref:Ig-like domain-containing protein n=1 Tax=Cellulomonas fengjieae TaxID=2819978 RepID=UPI001AAF0015|nr:DUF11 domain-containing protein [Cellulomonas fengjieae]MBO3103949.1 hypothetical protein [Cellulomonas fengjieae]